MKKKKNSKKEGSFSFSDFGKEEGSGLLKPFGKETFLWDCCLLCGEGKKSLLTTDHLFPSVSGGLSDFFNYVTLCKVCNSDKKGDVVPTIDFLRSLLTGEDEDKKQERWALLEEVFLFSSFVFAGKVPYCALRGLRCPVCNPGLLWESEDFSFYDRVTELGIIEEPGSSLILLPRYFREIIMNRFSNRNFLVNRCPKTQLSDDLKMENYLSGDGRKELLDGVGCFSSDRERVTFSSSGRSVVAFDSSRCEKWEVIASRVPDRSKTRIRAGVNVFKKDKFFVPAENCCYVEVIVPGNEGSTLFLHESSVRRIENNAGEQ